jgi:NOL1/NOP2/sun family putative RNA methylase
MNLPQLFEDRMKSLLGEEYDSFIQSYSNPHFCGLRVNILKIATEEFENICPFSIKKIPWVSNGYYYSAKEQPSKHPFYYAGLYYIQEPSAMTPASLLPISKGDRVLDICAAPGGKSTELGARLGGEGLLVSNDISNSRAKALLKNIELLGIANALIISEAPNRLADYFPEYFDKILIDAPCSGEGMFRKSPAIMKNWEQYGVDYYNKLQKDIILYAAQMLKPGGYMLYSTCTFSPEEDEGTVSYLLKQFPQFHVVDAVSDGITQKNSGVSYDGFAFGRPEWLKPKEEYCEMSEQRSLELKKCIRLWPHKINGEGHFIALLCKDSGDNSCVSHVSRQSIKMNRAYRRKNDGMKNNLLLSREALEFFQELHIVTDFKQFTVRENRVYLTPKGLPDLKGLRILRQGLLLGEMKKQRFEPSQALANALKKSEYDKIINLQMDDPDVIHYLKCETLEPKGSFENGWYLVCVDGFPLGWSKITNAHFKNKYLPGWRWV